MKRIIILLLLALFLLGASACPTEPEETIGAPPAFPEVPEPDKPEGGEAQCLVQQDRKST